MDAEDDRPFASTVTLLFLAECVAFVALMLFVFGISCFFQ